ncbi:hypothetical protein [Lysobacter soli]|uniref:hypothetical protein n=1 Tax=Lysobacter soli TaxID=453783 RepID=UPI00209ECFD7|nr:hypothetical protein [Lysobacter soli]MDG2519363.1 hypothetical protein [Lysobacter soli]UTA53171.1 hypothetical protein L3D22_12390 [Lysobacter soli]
MATKFPWPEIELRLRQLRLSADDLKERFPEEDQFFPRFADLADAVREAANDDCIEDASVRITDILIDLGYVPEHERQH